MPAGTCGICGTYRKWLHRHHVKPRCEGGTDADGTQMLCANCHEDVHEGPMGGKSFQHLRQSPEARAKRAASLKLALADPAVRARISKRVKAQWNDPAIRERRVAGLVKARASSATPEGRENRAAAAKRRWADPAKRAALMEAKHAKALSRDRRIAELTKDNWTAEQIAQELGCSTVTVTRVRRRQRQQ